MKRNDFIIAAAALLFAVVWFLVMQFGRQNGSTVMVYVEGNLTGTYALAQDREVLIKNSSQGTNLLEIKDGYASITEASCPDKLCVYQRKISKDGETIVCLPNKVVVEISGGEESPYDAVTN